MNEEALRAEFLRHIDPSPYLVDIQRFNDRQLWEMSKRIAEWADARARRECAAICDSEHNRLLSLPYDHTDDNEVAYQEGKQVSASKLRNSILATIKEPAP